MKKYIIVSLLLCTTFLPCNSIASANNHLRKQYEKVVAEVFIDNPEYIINEEKIFAASAPFIYLNRALVPLDVIGKIFHPLKSEYDGQVDSFKYWFKDLTIVLYHNNPIAIVNGENVTLDVPAVIRCSRFQIPLRFIAETLGASVEWEPKTHKITIVYEPKY